MWIQSLISHYIVIFNICYFKPQLYWWKPVLLNSQRGEKWCVLTSGADYASLIFTCWGDKNVTSHNTGKQYITMFCQYIVMLCHCNTVTFLWNLHNRHPIACLWEQDIGCVCEFNVWFMFCCCHCSAQYDIIIYLGYNGTWLYLAKPDLWKQATVMIISWFRFYWHEIR